MGFLDHSTNNILVDAVLTTEGRESLADGTFKIEFYSFGDDEIDYSIIRKYGSTVGKEKIEKNTPIFEAFTNSVVALKYPLLSITPDTIAGTYYYPTPSFSGDDVSADILTLRTITKPQSSGVSYKVAMTGNEAMPESFRDGDVAIEVDDDILQINTSSTSTTQVEVNFSYPDGTRVYDVPTQDPDGLGKSESISVSFAVKSSIINSTSTFNLYKVSGLGTSGTYIRTFAHFIHRDSGVRKTLEIRIFND